MKTFASGVFTFCAWLFQLWLGIHILRWLGAL